MSQVATVSMCAFCFDHLVHHFDKSIKVIPPDFPIAEYPLFVTWNKKGQLRGCIGTFSPLRLDKGLSEYALVSALQDTRFRPMQKSEIPDLEVDISILHSFEPAAKWNDWEIGKHGIRVKLNLGGRSYGATYLPQVMPEQGWNHQEAVESCLEKGGYRGVFDDNIKAKVEVTRYQSSIAELTYPQYLEWRKQKESRPDL